MRPSLTEQEILDFRERLVHAAETIFAKKGIEGVTMREIARETGVSAMTAYRYFADKTEVLAAVRADVFDRFSEKLERARRSFGAAGRKGRAVGEAYLSFALDDPNAYRLIFDLSQENIEAYPDLARAQLRARDAMAAYMRDLVLEGRVNGDPEFLGLIYWAAVHGLITLFLAGKLGDEKELRKAYRAMMRTLTHGAKNLRADD